MMVTRERMVRARLVVGEAVEAARQEVQLQDRGVQRIADLVREAERERAHGGERLGVGRAALERAALGHVDADAVDEIELAARVAHARRGASECGECRPSRRRSPASSFGARAALRLRPPGGEAIAILSGAM